MSINSMALAKKSLDLLLEYSNDEPHVVVEAGNLERHLDRVANYIKGRERRVKVLEEHIERLRNISALAGRPFMMRLPAEALMGDGQD